MKTIVEFSEYKGHPMLSIWKVDDDGKKIGEYPVISFGLGKAKAIVEHASAIEKFVVNSTSRDPGHV